MAAGTYSRALVVGFLPGALLGTVLAGQLAPLWEAGAAQQVGAYWQLLAGSLQENLRGALLPFAVLLLVYSRALQQLNRFLGEHTDAVEEVLRWEQIVDLCAVLFFGVGVIWTAIGMREALISALASPGAGPQGGAFEVLQGMVDGGILLALSTTIVGGIGGYLMRVAKTLIVGRALNALYLQVEQAPARELLQTLRRIERLLECRQSAGKMVGAAEREPEPVRVREREREREQE